MFVDILIFIYFIGVVGSLTSTLSYKCMFKCTFKRAESLIWSSLFLLLICLTPIINYFVMFAAFNEYDTTMMLREIAALVTKNNKAMANNGKGI